MRQSFDTAMKELIALMLDEHETTPDEMIDDEEALEEIDEFFMTHFDTLLNEDLITQEAHDEAYQINDGGGVRDMVRTRLSAMF